MSLGETECGGVAQIYAWPGVEPAVAPNREVLGPGTGEAIFDRVEQRRADSSPANGFLYRQPIQIARFVMHGSEGETDWRVIDDGY
jgi:hypothetical protein